jgi:GH35 family endo-1,4-beta-xylanase
MVLLKGLIKDGVPIHGVGIQGHWSTTNFPYAAVHKAIANYGSLRLKVSITELDVTILGASGGQFGRGGGFGGRRMAAGPPPSPQDVKAQADAYASVHDLHQTQTRGGTRDVLGAQRPPHLAFRTTPADLLRL